MFVSRSTLNHNSFSLTGTCNTKCNTFFNSTETINACNNTYFSSVQAVTRGNVHSNNYYEYININRGNAIRSQVLRQNFFQPSFFHYKSLPPISEGHALTARIPRRERRFIPRKHGKSSCKTNNTNVRRLIKKIKTLVKEKRKLQAEQAKNNHKKVKKLLKKKKKLQAEQAKNKQMESKQFLSKSNMTEQYKKRVTLSPRNLCLTSEEAKNQRAKRFSCPTPVILPKHKEKNTSFSSKNSAGINNQQAIKSPKKFQSNMERTSTLQDPQNSVKELTNRLQSPNFDQYFPSLKNTGVIVNKSPKRISPNYINNTKPSKVKPSVALIRKHKAMNSNASIKNCVTSKNKNLNFPTQPVKKTGNSGKNSTNQSGIQKNKTVTLVKTNVNTVTVDKNVRIESTTVTIKNKNKKKAKVKEKKQMDEPSEVLTKSAKSSNSELISSASNKSLSSCNEINTSDEMMEDVEMLDISSVPSLDVLNDAMDVDSALENQECYTFVVDTNVFMNHLNFIDALKDTPLEGSGPPIIWIPWIVICELDRLKNPKITYEKRKSAIDAIRYIYFMFDTKHPRIRGQSAKMANDLCTMFGATNDDQLLSYCIALAQKTPNERVCLLTDDKNLCNKAYVNNIKVFTKDTIFDRLKPDVRVYRDKDFISKLYKNEIKSVEDNKQEADAILCESKMLLKQVMEPFLFESMEKVYGDISKNFLKPKPTTLSEILEFYKKYWIAVFGPIFDKSGKNSIETLLRLFDYKRGYVCTINDAYSALLSMENLCKSVIRKKPTNSKELERIQQLLENCKTLIGSISALNEKETPENQSETQVAVAVFNHIWLIINQLCGMILDFAGAPHNYEYDKTSPIPPKREFMLLLSNIIPAMHLLKEKMSRVMAILDKDTTNYEKEYKGLYDSLFQFVPSLEIQANPPPLSKFTLKSLKKFLTDPSKRSLIQAGFQQLVKYQQHLHDCIQLPIWRT